MVGKRLVKASMEKMTLSWSPALLWRRSLCKLSLSLFLTRWEDLFVFFGNREDASADLEPIKPKDTAAPQGLINKLIDSFICQVQSQARPGLRIPNM